MDTSKHLAAQKLYLYLAALFITSLVVSNLIFQKFFYWYPFDWEIMGNSLFELSVGILPYPITFLVTDLISEIFGKKAANRVVVAGIFASFFSIGILLLAGVVPALPNSPIDDVTFNKVFALSPIAVLASMMAYLFAQFIDIRIYHFWKNLTKRSTPMVAEQLLHLCLPVYRHLYRCWLVVCLWCVAMGCFPRSINFWRCV